jgi:hypothetical protein
MGLYDTRIDDELIESIRRRQAANADLVAFTGGRVVGAEWEELDGPLVTPLLAISPRRADGKRMPSGTISLDYVVRFRLYLPRATPAVDSLASPGRPTVTASGSGAVSGGFYCGVTAFNRFGESWLTRAALPSATNPITRVTAASQRLSWSWPAVANADGYRLWRSEDGGLAMRWLATTDETSFEDNVPDAELGQELAPIKWMAMIIKGWVQTDVLSGEVYRTITGRQLADPATEMSEIEDRPLQNRNLRVIAFDAHFPSRITTSRQPAVSVPG